MTIEGTPTRVREACAVGGLDPFVTAQAAVWKRLRPLRRALSKRRGRPRSDKLRSQYAAAAGRLGAQGLRPTVRALAQEMGIPLETVKSYFQNNPYLGRQLGVWCWEQLTREDYAVAIRTLGPEFTVRDLASSTGRTYSAAYYALRRMQPEKVASK